MTQPAASTPETWTAVLAGLEQERAAIFQGGGAAAIARQHERGRMTARERIAALIDAGTSFMELGTWAGFQMYDGWGGAPAAGVVVGIGRVENRRCMIIANDSTVKAGAFFPTTTKKVLRAQRMAMENRLPLLYLVDSAGVFLPLQDEVFPDDDDFGRIFRNNAVLSAMGVPQIAAILGHCVAGGGYLPVLCDKLLMTEGSGLFLAGPALVKSSIGQQVTAEELGGALMHGAVSGTIDFREPDDTACLRRLRQLVAMLPEDRLSSLFRRAEATLPKRPPDDLYGIVGTSSQQPYNIRDVLDCVVDAESFCEYKADYGRSMVCGYARIGGFPVGIVANQHVPEKSATGALHFGGVIYREAAEKAARFVMDCNQTWLPIVFLQDVYGFMVGRDSEQQGIIRAGAKLVNAISNSRVPKLTLILGGSFGAGNYALCGKAFDPRFIFAWPTAKYAVMGAAQAAGTLLDINVAALKRAGREIDAAEMEALRKDVADRYTEQTGIRYGAARLWVDEIIPPASTRDHLLASLEIVTRFAEDVPYQTGVLQV